MSLVAVFAAVFVVWYLRVLEVPLRDVAWSFLGFWLAYLGAGHYTDRLRTARGLLAALQILQLSTIGYLLWLWHLLGGVRNLPFMMVLVLPVVISGVLMQRWQPYVTACLSVMAVWWTVIAGDPSFRWYVSQFVPLLGRLPGVLGADPGAGSAILPDVQLTPPLTLTALMTFTLVQALTALFTESLSASAARLRAGSVPAADSSARPEGIFESGLRAVPVPTLLVDAVTARVVGASESFLRQMVLDRSDLSGREIFDLLEFERPHEVRGLLEKHGGVLPECRYGIGGERRRARVSVETFEAGGGRYAAVVILDQSSEEAPSSGEAAPRRPRAISG